MAPYSLPGYTRLVSTSYLFLLLSSLLLILQSNAYLPDAVPLDEIVTALEEDHADDVRREVLLALLTKWFGRRTEHTSDSSVASVVLDGEKITRFIGEEMLKKEGAKVSSVVGASMGRRSRLRQRLTTFSTVFRNRNRYLSKLS